MSKGSSSQLEVKVVLQNGAIERDGILDRIEKGERPRVLFMKGKPHDLCPGQIVVTRISESDLQGLPRNTPVLLVEAWGCGGTYMQRGFFTQALQGSMFCFASARDGEAEPRNIGKFGNGAYKVLAGM